MSFAGTVSWMAPEVIRNEPCSEKVDIWSYGVVLWELLTCEIPYKDVDSSAIIWGVGNNSLQLPIPSTCPEGLKLLMKQCWSPKPRNRPPFKIILTHLEIAGVELLHKFDEDYYEQQKSWREEIREHLQTCQTNSTNIHKYEQDLIRKRQDEWKHAKDVRLIYERKLERTNNLYMELSACFTHLEEREREIAEREKQIGASKPYRKIVSQLRKHHFDKISRRRFCVQSPATPEANSTTPSPLSTPNSPMKASLYVQLDGQQTKSVAVQPVTHGGGSMRKKMRHRRVGSGSLMMPKASPNRDRRIQSEPETRAVKLVDTETQTDSMDISETDLSPTTPNPIPEVPEESSQITIISTKREMTLCLRTDENNKQFVTVVKKTQSSSSSGESDIDDCVPQNEDTTSSSQTNNNLIMMNSMATSIMTGSNLSYDYDSNDHLNNFRECSDDDNLETLGRKVSELISETTSTISTVSSTSTIINKNSPNNNIVSYSSETQCKCISRRNSVCGLENDNNLNTTKCSCAHESIDDEAGSWTDEDVDHQQPVNYSYSLRRKR